jgi:cytochrome c-type biogenesis protein CcmH
MRAKIILTLLLLTLKASGLTLQDVEGDIICTCGCGKLLKNCDCGAAEKMREEISAMIEEGKNREEIVSAGLRKRGARDPTKGGLFPESVDLSRNCFDSRFGDCLHDSPKEEF